MAAVMLVETPSILITDDDSAFRETLRAMFEPRGFRTLTAASGEETLRILGLEKVHLLLLDMHMPRLTGLETVRRLREVNSLLPCVLLSAALDETIRQQARLIDVFSVLSKPVSQRELTSTVDQVFRRVYGWPE
jgi:two-component system chemotaxis response regulator CheY